MSFNISPFKTSFLIFSFFLTFMNANELSDDNVTVCESPSVALNKFSKNFRYGCFCGANYPAMEHASNKSYKDLNSTQSKELVATYNKVKAYDDIDEACKQHDICYIENKKNSQTCNDTLYSSLKQLKRTFRSQEQRSDPKQKRCRVLASDMSAVFKTIFTQGDGLSIPRLSVFSMNTPMVMLQKGITKSKYPLFGETCLVNVVEE